MSDAHTLGENSLFAVIEKIASDFDVLGWDAAAVHDRGLDIDGQMPLIIDRKDLDPIDLEIVHGQPGPHG